MKDKKKWFGRLKAGLSKTRNQFSDKLGALVLGKKTIDDELLEELEMVLITADVGVDTSEKILQNLAKQVKRKELSNPEMLIKALKQQLFDLLAPLSQPLEVTHKPFIILMVGVNGAGKTTSIAKLAHYYQQQGKTLLLAAGDTFRAAAIEQLQTWGERNNVPVIAQQPGADSASVIYDAVQSTQAKQQDLLIADTAGRLHTQHNLMEELKKIKRVMSKLDENAPHETLLVIDASLGQNSLNQAKAFHEAIGVTGLCITKLDGSAKGGIIFAIARELALPIRFIGVGEGMDDLQPFDAQTFVDALWQDD
ncbi:MAG: signal recognition particle-docking protein FtsY [Coxiellaceae bacterium]|nr:signal recognition particle-docking protein FtsY [Coxiellaceae bacterium]